MNRLRSGIALINRYPRRTAAGVGMLSLLVLLLRMFVPSAVGLADQGDGHRLLCQLGFRNDVPWGASQSEYVYFTWLDHQFYGETCGANGTGQPYYSSHLTILRLASALTRLLGLPGDLDLRALAILCCLLAAVAIGWLVAELRGPVLGRVVAGILVLILIADSGVAGYFASPYAEPGTLLGVLFLCPAVLRFARDRTPLTLGAVTAIAAFTITTKTQMISLVPAFVVLALVCPIGKDSLRGSDSRRYRLAIAGLRRVPGVLAAAVLVGLGMLYLSTQPARFSELNQYNQVFGTILPSSPDPEADLRWFGLDPELASGSGSTVASPNSVAAVLPTDFVERTEPAAIAGFYLSHPGRIWGLVWKGLQGATEFRLGPYLANYPADSGQPPNSVEHRIEVFTEIFRVLHGAPSLLLILWTGGLLAFWLLRRRGSVPAALGLVLLTAAIGQFAVVLLTDGVAELIKHQFVVDVLSALCLPVLVAAMLAPHRSGELPSPGDETAAGQNVDDESGGSEWTDWEIHDIGAPSPHPRYETGS